jgi:hypothetical protein
MFIYGNIFLAVSPDRLPPAGTEKLVTSDDKRQLRGTTEVKKEVPKVPMGPVRYIRHP